MTEPFLPKFLAQYHDRLLRPNGNNPIRDRASSLKKVFQILDGRSNPLHIVETGTTRSDHGPMCFGDDGCATVIFDDLINTRNDGSTLVSIDIEARNCDYARSVVTNKTSVVCGDSVRTLWGLNGENAPPYDLLYLDSYDIIKENPHPSQLHHVMELCAAMSRIKKNHTVVVVDDHDAFFTGGRIGKGNYVHQFMDNIGAVVVHIGYQVVWIV